MKTPTPFSRVRPHSSGLFVVLLASVLAPASTVMWADTVSLLSTLHNDSGDYRVTVSNAAGGATSTTATLTVLPVPPGAGWVDLTFHPVLQPTFVSPLMPVEAIALQPNGKLLVGGSFSNANDVACSNLVRLDPDGTVDPTLNLALTNFYVDALAVLPDGKILAGGTRYAGGSQGNSLVRLHPDGSLDTNVHFGLVVFPGLMRVPCLAVQPDGRIVVSLAVCIAAPGMCFNIVARVNADGSLDSTFRPLTNTYWQGRALVLQPDGKLVLGGAPIVTALAGGATLPGQSPTHLVRLNGDGSLDTNFLASVNEAVNAVVLQPDGRFLIGGHFRSINGSPRPRIARLNADGSLDSSFQANVNEAVTALALQTDGRVLLGGRFTHVNGVPRSGFARLNADGTLDGAMQADVTYAGGMVHLNAIVVQPDGLILIGGRFTSVNGVPRTHLARLLGELPVAPTITVQPVSQTKFAGQRVTFTVEATGTLPQTCQWQKNGVNLFNDERIDGAQMAMVVIANVQPGDAGRYSVIVSNMAGSVSSSEATLTVLPVPIGGVIGGPVTNDANGHVYYLLARTNWTAAEAEAVALSGHLVTINNAAENAWVHQTFSVGNGCVWIGLWRPPEGMFRWANGELATFTNWAPGEPNDGIGAGEYVVMYVEDTVYGPAASWNDGPDSFLAYFGVPDPFGVVEIGPPESTVPGSVDLSFDPGTGPGFLGPRLRPVAAIVPQADGKILIGGGFASYDGFPRTGLARLNADGTLDLGFAPQLGSVDLITVQPDGKILVAGWFTSVNGVARTNLARLNPDGSLDLSFDPKFPISFDPGRSAASITAVVLQPDGKVLVTVGWDDSYLFRFHADGSLDDAFPTSCPAGLLELAIPDDCAIETLAVQSDGKILYGGSIYQVPPGAPSYLGTMLGLVRRNPDGCLDTSFTPRVRADDSVSQILVQLDDRILLRGHFTEVNGVPRAGLARLNADGTLDPSFGPPPASSSWPTCALAPDGRLVFANGIQLNPDGTVNERFHPDIEWAPPWWGGGTVAVQADGNVILSGEFTAVNGVARPGLARLHGDLTLVAPVIVAYPARLTRYVGQSVTFTVSAVGTFPMGYQWLFDGHPFLGTTRPMLALTNVQLTSAGSYAVIVSNAAGAVTSDTATLTVLPMPSGPGSVDFSFDPTGDGAHLAFEPDVGWPTAVDAIALQPDGKAIVGGDFIAINGVPCMNVARVLADGSPDPSFDTSWGADGAVESVAVQADGKVLLAGSFGRINAVERTAVARLNPDASLDLTFNPHLAGQLSSSSGSSLLLQPDGGILICGSFTNVNGIARPGLARLNADGSLDPSFVPSSLVAESSVWLLALQADGRLLLGGNFASLNQEIIRLNSDGSHDLSFQPESSDPSPPLRAGPTAVQPDGKVLVGHGYEDGLLRLNPDGSLDHSFQRPDMILGWVGRIVVQPDGRILIGGSFGSVNGVTRRSLARFNSDGTLDLTFDPGFAAGPELHLYHYPEVTALTLAPDGQVLVGARAEGELQTGYCFFRLEPNGSRDSELSTALTPACVTAATLAPQADGKILVNGLFQAASGVPCHGLARLNGDGSFDSSFNLGPLVDTWLGYLARQPDGRLLFSCTLSNFAGGPRSLVRLNGDGSFDPSLLPVEAWASGGYQTGIGSAALQPDDKMVIGGAFYSINGVERHYVARLNADGTLDTEFVPAHLEVGDDWYVTGVGVQRDGKIVVAGHIFDVPWETYYGLARLNPDGSLDTDFRARVRVNGPVFRMLIQPDDKILFGGSFSLVNGVDRPSLARLNADGSLDTAFNPPEAYFDGPPTFADTLALAPDSKIIVATDRQVLRLNPDGSVDATFRTEVGRTGWSGGLIEAVAVQADGSVYISGNFATVNGVPARGLVRLQGNVTPVAPSLSRQPHNQAPYAGQSITFTVDASGTLPISFQWQFNGAPIPDATNATFTLSNVQPANAGHYAVVVANAAGSVTSGSATLTVLPASREPGSLDLSFDPGLGADAGVSAVAVQNDGKIILGGFFSSFDSVPRNHFARLNANGSLDLSFDPGSGADFNVYAVAAQADGKVLIAGGFTSVNGLPRQHLARLNADGSVDTSFSPQMDRWAVALVLQPDGKMVIGGDFTVVNGVTRRCIARLNADGSLDTSFQPSPGVGEEGPIVMSLALQPDGKVILGGVFARVNGTARRHIARLNNDGSLDTGFDPGTGPDITVWAVAVQRDGKVVLGGGFATVDGVPRRGLARLNANGSLDLGFDPGAGVGHSDSPSVHALAIQPDGKILAAGWFDWFNGYRRTHLVRLHPNGSLDTTFAPDIECSGWGEGLSAVEVQPDGQVLIAGDLVTVNGLGRNGIARLNNDVPVPFVRREIAEGGMIRLVATPSAQTSVYAVEDQPPTGWPVSTISHGGVFDAATGKVKFGPFYDAEPRALSYEVLSPVWGIHCALGVFCFNGQASADGVSSPIVGDQCRVLAGYFPADVTPANRRISIDEVTAYGAAWRRGSNWECHEQEIPIDYVTRAGALWRSGECYTVDFLITNEPLWWVPCPAEACVPPGPVRAGFQAAGGTAERQVPAAFVPGEPLAVTITVRPAAEATAYAVEDALPAGWTVARISQEGELDALHGKVKWGPFLDNAPRTLSCQVTPPPTASGPGIFAGVASFDGVSLLIAGSKQSREACRFAVGLQTLPAQFYFTFAGRQGGVFLIETSTDLVTWIHWTTTTNVSGRLWFQTLIPPGTGQGFYRARLVE